MLFKQLLELQETQILQKAELLNVVDLGSNDDRTFLQLHFLTNEKQPFSQQFKIMQQKQNG